MIFVTAAMVVEGLLKLSVRLVTFHVRVICIIYAEGYDFILFMKVSYFFVDFVRKQKH